MDPVVGGRAIQLNNNKMLALGNVSCIWKEGEFLPALAVAASRDSRGECVGDGGSRMCLWAEISTDTCMVRSDVIEKNYEP